MYKSYFDQVESILAENIAPAKKVEKLEILTSLMKNIAQTAPEAAQSVLQPKMNTQSSLPQTPLTTAQNTPHSVSTEIKAPTLEQVRAEGNALSSPTLSADPFRNGRQALMGGTNIAQMKKQTSNIVKGRSKK